MRTTPALVLSAALLLPACTAERGEPDQSATSAPTPPSGLAALATDRSLTSAGRELVAGSDLGEAVPRLQVTASADPATGTVKGTVRASLPVGAADEVSLRYFPALESFDAHATAGPVLVDAEPAESRLDRALLSVDLPSGHGDVVQLEVPFSYALPEAEPAGPLDALVGGDLQPADIGLLARHPTQLSLGHWFPLWVPPGMRDDPEPSGYGDIGNFPAAELSLELTVPRGWTVVDGGVRVDERVKGGRTTITSHGSGMRDLSVAVVKGFASRSREVGEVTVTAWGPGSERGQLNEVLDEAARAIEVLSESFGAYPWREFDVVSAPLGGSVAGMEWPGATWIQADAFAGGIPGLGEVGDLLGPLLGSDELGGAGDLLSTIRVWTIAHEVAHSWWTVLVGNDSIAAPVVDEPLAQYSACLVLRAIRDDADDICRGQIVSGYQGMRATGARDVKADQATDEFASPVQYGGVIYGKAAWFYLALEERYGADRLKQALRAVVQAHAFDMITGADLRATLVSALDQRAGRLWDRWMRQTHGDQDMPESDIPSIRDLLQDLG